MDSGHSVFAVFVFHAFPKVPVFKGGFVGVDVFFVISGFLISSIIYTQLEKGTFSFWDFYSRRIRRIYPVLLTVLIACMGFGWFYLLADEYMQLGKHIAGGAGFVSNFVLFFEKGYFDNASATKPLLHLWSLGIEEQFYIFWPLILWLTWKVKKDAMFWVAFAIAIVSMAMNVYWYTSKPEMDFFLPHTRIWELVHHVHNVVVSDELKFMGHGVKHMEPLEQIIIIPRKLDWGTEVMDVPAA